MAITELLEDVMYNEHSVIRNGLLLKSGTQATEREKSEVSELARVTGFSLPFLGNGASSAPFVVEQHSNQPKSSNSVVSRLQILPRKVTERGSF